MNLRLFLIYAAMLSVITASTFVCADEALVDVRCCVTPERDGKGVIARRADVRHSFQKLHPCPSTGFTSGACPNWAKDHVIPLDCGGKDVVSNMQWLPLPIKSASGMYPKDRWERLVNCSPAKLVK